MVSTYSEVNFTVSGITGFCLLALLGGWFGGFVWRCCYFFPPCFFFVVVVFKLTNPIENIWDKIFLFSKVLFIQILKV